MFLHLFPQLLKLLLMKIIFVMQILCAGVYLMMLPLLWVLSLVILHMLFVLLLVPVILAKGLIVADFANFVI